MSILDVIGKDHNVSHTAHFTTWTVQPRRFVKYSSCCRLLVHAVGRTELGKCAQKNANWLPEETNLLVLYVLGDRRGTGSWHWCAKNACFEVVYELRPPMKRPVVTGAAQGMEAPNLVLLHSLELSLWEGITKPIIYRGDIIEHIRCASLLIIVRTQYGTLLHNSILL